MRRRRSGKEMAVYVSHTHAYFSKMSKELGIVK